MKPRQVAARASAWHPGADAQAALRGREVHARTARCILSWDIGAGESLPGAVFGALFFVQPTVFKCDLRGGERLTFLYAAMFTPTFRAAFPPKNFFRLGDPPSGRANAALGSFGHGRCHRQAVARHLAAIQSVPPVPPDRTRHGTGRRATPPTTPTADVLLPPPLPPLRRSPGTRVQASLRPRDVGRHPKSVGAARRRRDSAAAEVAAARTRWSTAAARQAAEVRGRFRPRRRLSRRTGFRMLTQASRQERSRARGRARPLPLRFHGLAPPLRAQGAWRGWISHQTSPRSPISNPSPIPNRRGGARQLTSIRVTSACGAACQRAAVPASRPAQPSARLGQRHLAQLLEPS